MERSENMNFEEMIINKMKYENKRKCQLPQRRELLLYLNNMMLTTGRSDAFFCNAFLAEAIQLIQNSIFLYEDGYFECAFYSLRESYEIFGTMLYVENGEDKLSDWKKKKWIPSASDIRKDMSNRKTKDFIEGYKEIRECLKNYFSKYEKLINKSNKIIHKQGYDTFYTYRMQKKFDIRKEQKLFLNILKYSIGMGILLLAVLDPISIALADDKIERKIPYDLVTEAFDYSYFEKILGQKDIFPKILKTKFYKKFVSQFQDKEEMNEGIYNVIRNYFWNVARLEEIQKQKDMLSSIQLYELEILKSGIKAAAFYYADSFICETTSYSGSSWERDLSVQNKTIQINDKRFNRINGNTFISIIFIENEKLYIAHDKKLTEKEQEFLKRLERTSE